MVTRIWEGRTKNEHANVYTNIIIDRDLPGYEKTPGFVKHSFLIRADNEFTYFKLLTYWLDLEAIKTFTGPNYEVAKAYDEDEQYVVDFPGSVSHFSVFS